MLAFQFPDKDFRLQTYTRTNYLVTLSAIDDLKGGPHSHERLVVGSNLLNVEVILCIYEWFHCAVGIATRNSHETGRVLLKRVKEIKDQVKKLRYHVPSR